MHHLGNRGLFLHNNTYFLAVVGHYTLLIPSICDDYFESHLLFPGSLSIGQALRAAQRTLGYLSPGNSHYSGSVESTYQMCPTNCNLSKIYCKLGSECFMTKKFEDYFSEPQTDMVAICMEYSEHKADDIYIYCSYEPNMYAFDVFFKSQDMVVHTHKLSDIHPEIDTSIERQKAMLAIGNQNFKSIHDICEEYNHDMPTEMKLHYRVKENSLQAKYRYDLIYSNQEMLLPDHIFDEWIEEIKNESNK